MKIKELLHPILKDLEETIETYGEDEYDFDGWEPHLELMYKDTYHMVDDIYFIVEDDGDVVLRINTDHLTEQVKKYDVYSFIDEIEKLMDKYDMTFLYEWDEKGIRITYGDEL